MKKIITDLKLIVRNYRYEIWVLFAAFLFAAIGDWRYGGVAGAETSLIGLILGQVSGFFFTIFSIMVLVGLLYRLFMSNRFQGLIRSIPVPEAEPTKKGAKKTK